MWTHRIMEVWLMTYREIKFEKSQILQQDVDNAHFQCTELDGLKFDPPDNGEQCHAVGVNSCYPLETTMPHWNTVKYNLTRSTALTSDLDFKLIVSLLGLNIGSEELIAEHIITSIGTETTETRSFDLTNCASYPALIPVNETASSGKIKVYLPMRALNYESLSAYLCTLWQSGTITSGWTVVSGTRAVGQQPDGDGNNWIQHTGNGSDSYNNLIYATNTSTNYHAMLKFQLASKGSDSYVRFFVPRYVDSSNFISIATYFNGTNQILNFRKIESGVVTSFASVTWLPGVQLDVGTTYFIEVIDNGTHMTVVIDDVTYIDVDYSSSLATTKKAHGCNKTTSGYWDNLGVFELTQPDTYTDEDITINFTHPSNLASNAPIYLMYQEYENAVYEAQPVNVSSQSTVKMTASSLDAFSGLRLKFEIIGSEDYDVKINKTTFKYEV